MKRLSLCLFSPCLLAFGTAFAQLDQVDSPTSPSEPNPTDRAGLWTVGYTDGLLLAGSPSYAAEFRAGALMFTPALGGAAPHNLPVTIRLESIERGDATIVDARNLPPEPRLAGRTVIFDHAGNIQEQYEVRAEGLKQSVLFPERPAGSGDLMVRLALESELVGAFGMTSESVQLTLADYGGVTFSGVLGIDATGHQQGGSMRYTGSHLELVLPHSFVEAARYPLTLDPLIGSSFSAGASFDDYFPDAAYDVANDVYLVTWEFRASATDTDVWCTRLRPNNSQNFGGPRVAEGPGHQRRPTVATVAVYGTFLVAWEDDSAGNWDVRCRRLLGSDAFIISNVVDIAATVNDEVAPDAGSERTTFDDDAIVVWADRSRGIVAAQVTPYPNSLPLVFDETFIFGGDEPAISKSGGDAGVYCVAWEYGNQIAMRIFNRNITLRSLAGGFAMPQAVKSPDVDGDGLDFTLIYEVKQSASSTSASDVWVTGVRDANNAASTPFVGFAPRVIEGEANEHEGSPAIAFTGQRYTVGFLERGTSGIGRGYIYNLHPATGENCGPKILSTPANGWNVTGTTLASKWAGGAASDEGWFLFNHTEFSTGTNLLFAQPFRSVQPGSFTTLPTSCGAGFTLAPTGGSPIIGDAVGWQLSGVTGLGRIWLGLSNLNVPLCSGCVLGTDFLVWFGTDNLPPSRIPCDALLIGGSMYLQGMDIGSASGCNAGSFNYRLSDTIRITIGG